MGVFKQIGKGLKKALPVLKGIAPMAAGALGGPFAPIAMGLMKKLLGDQTMGDDAALEMVAAAEPATLLKLRQLDADLELARQNLKIKHEEMYIQDVQSARQRHMQVRDSEPARLTYLAIGLLVALVTFVAIWGSGLGEFEKQMLSLVLGALIANAQKGYNFFLGSSMGSKNKDDVLQDAINGTGSG